MRGQLSSPEYIPKKVTSDKWKEKSTGNRSMQHDTNSEMWKEVPIDRLTKRCTRTPVQYTLSFQLDPPPINYDNEAYLHLSVIYLLRLFYCTSSSKGTTGVTE